MKIDPEKHKQLMISAFSIFKKLESQILAYRMVFHALKTFHPDLPDLDEALELSLNSESLQKVMNAKYDPAVEMLTKRFDEAALESDLEQWLRDWKPTGPKN